ncbi:MAG: glutamine synthetase family protein, partial [Promethearchaeota archaeon]
MIDLNDKNRPEYVEEVIKTIKTKNIKFVRLQFIDINGTIKSFSVSTKTIEETMEHGQYFDGSSITGYGSIEESDMIAIPDPTTFAIIPWREEEISTCRLICDIYSPDGSRFKADPRYILQKVVNKAKEEGYIFKCAPELEFFILTEDETELRTPQPLDMKGYFDLHPGDITESLRREMCDNAEQFGITVEVAHHEVALGQNEIDFKYDEAVTTADRTVTMKAVIKGTAARNGYLATFMPKPFFGVNGSGMHVHQSLWTLDNQNTFYSDDPEKSNLSENAFYFIGG